MKFQREVFELPAELSKPEDLQVLVDRLNIQMRHLENLLRGLAVGDNLGMEFREFTWVGGEEPFFITPKAMAAPQVGGVFVAKVTDDGNVSVTGLNAVTAIWSLATDGARIQISELTGLVSGDTYKVCLLLVGV